MTRADIITRLAARQAELRERFGLEWLGLFGSAARDEMGTDSDVDILVKFAGPARWDSYVNLRAALEELVERRVDLVTETGLKPRARASVERDFIRVA
jgi:hypothetical protein